MAKKGILRTSSSVPSSWSLCHEALKSTHAAMSVMLQEGLHADIKLEIQGQTIHVHASVLASSSPVFRTMLNDKLFRSEPGKTLHLECISSFKALKGFLRLIYLAEFDHGSITWEHALEILAACHRYELSLACKAVCAQALCDMVTCSNCLKVIEYADLYDAGLVKHCKLFIRRHFKQVVLSDAFEEFAAQKPAILVDLVRSNTECSRFIKTWKVLKKKMGRCRGVCTFK